MNTLLQNALGTGLAGHANIPGESDPAVVPLRLVIDGDGASMIKNRIREHRKAAELSQEALADLCATTYSTISRLESGEIELTTSYVLKIAEALKVHPLELLTDDPIIRTDRERQLLEAVQGLSDEAMSALLASAAAMLKPG